MPDLDAVAAGWKLREPMTGSGSGCFNLRLMNQLWRAMAAVGPRDAWHEELAQGAARGALLGIAPRDPLEGLLAAQMLAVHDAAMECLRRAHLPEQTFEGRGQNLGQANRLVRSYAMLLEALDKHRGKGQPQVVRVERVTVEAGGRAIVGAVAHPGGGGGSGAGNGRQPHAPAALAHEPGVPLRGADPEGEPVPVAGGGGEDAM
jgi:hypothetical protein